MGRHTWHAIIASILLIITTALAQNNIAYGESCMTSLNEGTAGWIYGTSNSYNLGYTCGLSGDNAVTNDDGSVTFTIGSGSCTNPNVTEGCASGYEYACGETVSQQHTKYGVYTCYMKAQGMPGTIQSCQVVTSTRAPYEQIFMAYFGNVTKSIMLGFYAGGNYHSLGLNPLPFDGAGGYHNFTLVWTPSSITWFADLTMLSEVTTATQLPQWPNRFIQNFVTDAMDGVQGDWHYFPTSGIAGLDRSFKLPDSLNTSGISVTIRGRSYVPQHDWACPVGSDASVNPDDAPCTTARPLAIFVESFQNQWTDDYSTYVNTYDVRKQPSATQHSGYVTLAWTLYTEPTPSQIFFNAPAALAPTDYYGFEFWINGGYGGGYPISVYLFTSEAGAVSSGMDIGNFTQGGVIAGTWVRVVLPLTGFANTGDEIWGFMLQINGDKYSSSGGTVYIDDVYLINDEPVCANDTLTVFASTLSKSFNNGSWAQIDHTFNNKATGQLLSGSSYSLAWQLTFNSGVKFAYKGSVPAHYQALSFWIYQAEATSMNNIWVYLVTPNSGFSTGAAGAGPINLVSYYQGNLPDTEWLRVVIPFYEFGITTNTPITAVVFNWQGGYGGYDGVVYMDQIQFLDQTATTKPASDAASLTINSLVLLVSVLISVMYIL